MDRIEYFSWLKSGIKIFFKVGGHSKVRKDGKFLQTKTLNTTRIFLMMEKFLYTKAQFPYIDMWAPVMIYKVCQNKN